MLWLSVPFSCFLSGFRFFVRPLRKRASKNRPDACLEHLQNACILSGLACSHTGLGLSHILSQQLCCEFRISMSALQALLIPRLLLYYGSDSTHLSGKAWTVSSSACSADNYLKMLAAINPSFDGNRRAADILAEKLTHFLMMPISRPILRAAISEKKTIFSA